MGYRVGQDFCHRARCLPQFRLAEAEGTNTCSRTREWRETHSPGVGRERGRAGRQVGGRLSLLRLLLLRSHLPGPLETTAALLLLLHSGLGCLCCLLHLFGLLLGHRGRGRRSSNSRSSGSRSGRGRRGRGRYRGLGDRGGRGLQVLIPAMSKAAARWDDMR